MTVAISAALLMLLLALITTVHGRNDAQSRADALAAEAARAAETAINTRGTTITLDMTGAQAAACAYLAATATTGTVAITSPTTVTVTVTVNRPAVFTLFGPSYRATATKNAVLAVGPHA